MQKTLITIALLTLSVCSLLITGAPFALAQSDAEMDKQGQQTEARSAQPVSDTAAKSDSGKDLSAGISLDQAQRIGHFKIVHYKSDSLDLCGALFMPGGDGTHPTMVYNHGSEKDCSLGVGYGDVGRFYAQHGFVALVPLRRGHSFRFKMHPICSSEGQLFNDRVASSSGPSPDPHAKNQIWLKAQDVDNEDVAAAVEWLKSQPFVNKDQMVMSGISFGGIQTVLASEKGLGIKAFIPFAPGAMSWLGVPELHDRLKSALVNAKAPVFLIQAENDFNTGPSTFLGPVLDKKGGLNRHKLYPPFEPEKGPAAGHGGFATRAEAIWSPDVFAFIKDVLGPNLVINTPAAGGSADVDGGATQK